ncbi:SOSS complex subunit C-like protein [Dinothrombium tinctorium]|uniref:SOSS complex subunit C-like protein n=1 Tax=Dinothrombium tinctorium TaxID=1965070 RepID=A0A3S3S382_9ACAR|nr:SOSS complex subunit C-like protein [Dinothrombium tinctorium]
MSFKPPSARQEQQNRKILEDLQKKQQLLSKPQSQGNASNACSNQSFLENAVNNNGKESRERTALQHAHQNSFGFFITQDSSFGNLILPVLPRF